MAKPQKKGKANRGPKERLSFNQDALAQLTSKIDNSLSANDHKRKNPPTNAGSKQQQKRQRNSDVAPVKKSDTDDQAALLAEIQALGGDEKDLELINGVDSDDELDAQGSSRPIDKTLKDELFALSKELGFANIAPEEASDEEDPEDEEGDGRVGQEAEDDEQEHSDEDSEEEEDSDDGDEIKTIRKPGDMVCYISCTQEGIITD